MNRNNVLHVANYSAKYRGNFIESLSVLDQKLKERNVHSLYAFYLSDTNHPEQWMLDMIESGDKVFFLSGNVLADANLIRNIIKKEHVSMIHTHFISMKQYLSVLISSMMNGCKILMHFHNHSKQANSIKNIIRRCLYKKCSMIACSESVFQSICRDYPGNPKYRVDNGVYYQRIESLKSASREEYQLKSTSTVCLIFGFDFYRKGVDLAIQAIDSLIHDGLCIELVISLSKNFQEVTNNINHILGYVPDWIHIIESRNDVSMLYNMADIFLSPSREEGLPYSVLEAAYCKCNVIMSDISAQKNLKIPQGIMHKSEDISSLKKSIIDVINLGTTKTDHLDSAREKLLSIYSVERWANEVEKVYMENGL